MISPKKVIITLPKRSSKASELPHNTLSKLNLTTPILSDKVKVEARKMTSKQQEEIYDSAATLFKPASACVRKKNRLDHLTWEEKLQRKKLKNRVAAQTSRDRKKAKLDELEDTVKRLKEKNDLLSQECIMLRSQNESLVNENKKLKRDLESVKHIGHQPCCNTQCAMCQARVNCAVPLLGSAVSLDNPLPQGGTAQPVTSMTLSPGAAILLKILTLYLLSKSCLTSSRAMTISTDSRNWPRVFCEKLPPRWKRILIDQMNKEEALNVSFISSAISHPYNSVVPFLMTCRPHSTQISIKEDSVEKLDYPEGMVGQASENMEANRAAGSVDISYKSSNWCSTFSTVNKSCPTTPTMPIKTEIEIKQEPESMHTDLDTVYGTYDEATNSITILFSEEENDMNIQECVQEISSDDMYHTDDATEYLSPEYSSSTQFSPAYSCRTDTMSPVSTHSEDMEIDTVVSTKSDGTISDGGYESHSSSNLDMPIVNTDLADISIWHESFTELFPMLA